MNCTKKPYLIRCVLVVEIWSPIQSPMERKSHKEKEAGIKVHDTELPCEKRFVMSSPTSHFPFSYLIKGVNAKVNKAFQ
jgi:hypothetical protein